MLCCVQHGGSFNFLFKCCVVVCGVARSKTNHPPHQSIPQLPPPSLDHPLQARRALLLRPRHHGVARGLLQLRRAAGPAHVVDHAPRPPRHPAVPARDGCVGSCWLDSRLRACLLACLLFVYVCVCVSTLSRIHKHTCSLHIYIGACTHPLTPPQQIHTLQPPHQKPTGMLVKTLIQSVVLVDCSDKLPVSSSRQRSAFPPNFVHSLDSTHMLMTANRLKACPASLCRCLCVCVCVCVCDRHR